MACSPGTLLEETLQSEEVKLVADILHHAGAGLEEREPVETGKGGLPQGEGSRCFRPVST
jgi:hypothetical protein